MTGTVASASGDTAAAGAGAGAGATVGGGGGGGGGDAVGCATTPDAWHPIAATTRAHARTDAMSTVCQTRDQPPVIRK
jgi:hypothetical protein